MIRRAVIGTGPLLSALVVNHVRQRPLRISHHLLEHADEAVRHPDAQARFLDLLVSVSEKLTTSHVLGEINGLVNKKLKLREPDLSRF